MGNAGNIRQKAWLGRMPVPQEDLKNRHESFTLSKSRKGDFERVDRRTRAPVMAGFFSISHLPRRRSGDFDQVDLAAFDLLVAEEGVNDIALVGEFAGAAGAAVNDRLVGGDGLDAVDRVVDGASALVA